MPLTNFHGMLTLNIEPVLAREYAVPLVVRLLRCFP